MPAGKLYVCATPIGNLEDITLRALRVLREVALIAAEDTRHTRYLLQRHGVTTPLTSLHEHNEREKTGHLLERLRDGADVALVTDAGTPGIADPGFHLIRAAAEAGFDVVPVPGASALLAGLVVSGIPADRFAFEGFLPRRQAERRHTLTALAHDPRTLIFYEAPHRLLRTLDDLQSVLGDRHIAVGRELTKAFEEVVRGRVSDVRARFVQDKPQGEFVVVVSGAGDSAGQRQARPDGPGYAASSQPRGKQPTTEQVVAAVRELMAAGKTRRAAVREVAASWGIDRREVYRAGTLIRGGDG